MICLYRLLRWDENPENGLIAKNPNSNVSIEEHVTNGSYGRASRYISCCRSLDAARSFASRSVTRPRIIVEILTDANTVIDLTDEETRSMLVQNETGRNYARCFEEVLIEGYIPPECISIAQIIN